ncbi:MAG TPA: class I SAM-dependent methyltransferase [Gaiellaceae bacterium]|nr:class I SAM-dependent methyltransferase [Gaiellaceae bacterium]
MARQLDGSIMRPGLAARYWRCFGDARVVLDVGCGAGAFGRLRPSPEIAVHGVDADPRAVASAAEHEQALVVDLDEGRLPYDDETFDAVLAKDVLEHVRDPLAVAREINRVLKPGGPLVVSVIEARSSRVWSDYTHRRGFTRRSARALLEDSGFDVEAIWRMGPVPGADRLGLIGLVPALLRFPPASLLWGFSWELLARRATR